MPVSVTPPTLPYWANRKEQSAEMRRRQALKFLFLHAALLHSDKATLRSLARDCGYDESGITTSITRASVSKDLAKAVATTVGTKLFDADWLTNPESLM